MPKIRFARKFPDIEVETGGLLMEALLKAGYPVASSCHGDGICGKCRIQILAGAENLSKIAEVEQLVRDRLNVPKEYRISCQARVLGDVLIDTSYW
jgi:2Fe-2S ferredoxin